MAAEVARHIRCDVHAGKPALKAMWMILSMAATRHGQHSPRSVALHDITAAFVHATSDLFQACTTSHGRIECVLVCSVSITKFVFGRAKLEFDLQQQLPSCLVPKKRRYERSRATMFHGRMGETQIHMHINVHKHTNQNIHTFITLYICS